MPETQPVDRSFRFCIFLKVPPGDLPLPPAASQIRPKIRPQKKIKERSQKESPRAPFGASWAFKIKQKSLNRLSKAPPCAGPEKSQKIAPSNVPREIKKIVFAQERLSKSACRQNRKNVPRPHLGALLGGFWGAFRNLGANKDRLLSLLGSFQKTTKIGNPKSLSILPPGPLFWASKSQGKPVVASAPKNDDV